MDPVAARRVLQDLDTSPDDTLFLQYLSTGQFECARLAFILLKDSQSKKLTKSESGLLTTKVECQARLVAAGYRPSDWVYSKSCPSQAHLSWLCRSLVSFELTEREKDSWTFALAASALLVEAGFRLEQAPVGRPSDRVRRLAELLLSSSERLSELLCGPSYLVTIAWKHLRAFVSSVELRNTIVKHAVDALVAAHRYEDAASLVACGPDDDANVTEGLARACAMEDKGISRRILFALLASGANGSRTFRRIFRLRKTECKDINSCLLMALRSGDNSTSFQWFTRVVDDPFSVADAPLAVRLVHLLTLVGGDSEWCDRVLRSQVAVQDCGNKMIEGLLDLNDNDGHVVDTNVLHRLLQHRIDRLGFSLLCAESLTLSRDLSSARLAHELRNGTLAEILVTRLPPFSVDAVQSFGRNLVPGPGSIAKERRQIIIVKLAIWLVDIMRGTLPWGEIEALTRRLFRGSFKRELDQPLLESVIDVLVSKCLRCLSSFEYASRIVHLLRELQPENQRVLQAELRLAIGEVLLNGHLGYTMCIPSRELILLCLDHGKFSLALGLAECTGDAADLATEARSGLAFEEPSRQFVDLLPITVQVDLALLRQQEVESSLTERLENERMRKAIERTGKTKDLGQEELLQHLMMSSPSQPERNDRKRPTAPRTYGNDLPAWTDPVELLKWLKSHDDDEKGFSIHFVRTLLDMCDSLDVVPSDLVTNGLQRTIVGHVLRKHDAGADLLLNLCKKWRLEPRQVLLDSLVMETYRDHPGFRRLIVEVERQLPIKGFANENDQSSLLAMVFLPDQVDSLCNSKSERLNVFHQLSNVSVHDNHRSSPAVSIGEASEYSLEDASADFNSALAMESGKQLHNNISEKHVLREPDWLEGELQRVQMLENTVVGHEKLEGQQQIQQVLQRLRQEVQNGGDVMSVFDSLSALQTTKEATTPLGIELAAASLGLRITYLETTDAPTDPDIVHIELSEVHDVLYPELAARALNQFCDSEAGDKWMKEFTRCLRSEILLPWEQALARTAADVLMISSRSPNNG